MLIELAATIAKLGLFVTFPYVTLKAYSRNHRSSGAKYVAKHRLTILVAWSLLMIGVKLIEDVVTKESGSIDEAILWFVRANVPTAFIGLCTVITVSGSATFLVSMAFVAAVVLLLAKRRCEALLLTGSLLTAALSVYILKMTIGRARPALWEAQWFWGSSFPSGHVLSTAAFSTAGALCVVRIWPRYSKVAMSAAILWTGLVAVSRLVLGVHWPTDVLAAMCLGIFIPLLISITFDLVASGVEEPNDACRPTMPTPAERTLK